MSDAYSKSGFLQKLFGFFRYRFAGSLSGRQLRAVEIFAKTHKCTFILAEFGDLGLAASPLVKRTGLPLFVYFRGTDVNTGTTLWHLRVAYRAIVKDVCGAIFVSRELRAKLRLAGARIENTAVIPSGYDDKLFTYRPDGRPKEQILFVGRLTPGKRPLEVLEAFIQLLHHRPRAELIVVGDGPLKPLMKERVVSSGVELNVQLLGNATHEIVSRFMSSASLLVQYSDPDLGHEGMPSVIQEAMGCGCPLLVTLAGGVGEIASDSNAFISTGNPSMLASEIDGVLSNPILMKERARIAYLQAYERYSSTAILQRTREFIEESIDRSSPSV